MEHKCGIYCIKNKINNKMYIGKSINIFTRWCNHIYHLDLNNHQNKHLQQSWNKYGKTNFDFLILEECDIDDLSKNEIKWIKFYNTTNPNYGYNMTAGGEGVNPSPELSKQRSETLTKLHKENPERAKKVGKIISKSFVDNPEKRIEYRNRTLKQFKDPQFYKQFRELRSSEEFREKLRNANINKKVSDETKVKISKALGSPVRCVETGVIYPSAIEASRQMPGNVNINAVISGKRKTAGGYHWEKVQTA